MSKEPVVVGVAKAGGDKCESCRKYLPEVTRIKLLTGDPVCLRCAKGCYEHDPVQFESLSLLYQQEKAGLRGYSQEYIDNMKIEQAKLNKRLGIVVETMTEDEIAERIAPKYPDDELQKKLDEIDEQ